MITHVIPQLPLVGRRQLPVIPPGERQVLVELDTPLGAARVGTNTWDIVDRQRLSPPQVALELYRLAVLAYTADTRLDRAHAFDGWQRRIALYLPVSSAAAWRRGASTAESLLTFLTGDAWSVRLVPYNWPRSRQHKILRRRARPFTTSTVSLFSGGLDSLIGAIDLAAAGTPTYLVGHFESGMTKKVQAGLFRELTGEYPDFARLLQFMVQPGVGITGETEPTTRSRSFLFLSLATLVAASLGGIRRVILPENGFIALNPPMTPTRLGPLSTRTAHPHTLDLFQALLDRIGIELALDAPYALSTKGEMIADCQNQTLLRRIAPSSMSCAHPTSGRWREGVGYKHCGRCVPCLIRRASMYAAGWDGPSEYRMDILQARSSTPNLEDVRAFLTAIDRARTEPPLRSVLRAGPLPGRVADYGDVYRRGLQEAAAFLATRRTRRL